MELIEYFDKIDLDKLTICQKVKKNKYSLYHIDKNSKSQSITNLNDYKVAILGVPEERIISNKGTAKAPDIIREKFYRLNQPENARIVDLGNLKQGKTLNDTYIALSHVTSELIKLDIIPLIIGGSQDLTYGNFLAYKKLKKQINIVNIDARFDIGYITDDFDEDTHIGYIILRHGQYLFNYTNIGYQEYYVNKEEKKLINTLNFDALRLGNVRAKLKETEPVFRDADMVSLDISAVKQSEAPAFDDPSANGFYGEEICQLARYAGLSDKLSSFGIYNVNPKLDINNQTVNLCAQIIWYFIDGVTNRFLDYPVCELKKYTKYIVNFDSKEQNMIFYRNAENDRWWMEVPNPKQPSHKKIIACSYHDYKMACEQEIPDRWIRNLQKMR